MKLNLEDIKEPGKDAQPRRFKFELTPGGVFGLVIVAVLGVTWAFILGILVGRGFRPEKAVPELATIMPTPQVQNQTIPQEPLRAEDLQFYETLQKKPDGSRPMSPQPRTALAPESRDGGDSPAARAAAEQARKAEAAEKARAKVEVAEKAKAKAEAQKQAADRKAREAADRKAKAREAAEAKAAKAKAAKAEDARKSRQAEAKKGKVEGKYEIDKNDPLRDGVYHYIYQVASLENQSQAVEMQNKLKTLGFAASIEPIQSDGRTLYRVNVPFKGRPIDTREMKDKLATAGVKKPLLRSKKPI